MSDEATARIRNAQDLLVFMDDHQPGSAEGVLGLLDPRLRELLETASRTLWIPLADDARFVDATIDFFGHYRAEELWLAYTSRFVQTPLQRALFDGAIRVFGLSVGTFVRIIPRVWSTSFRGAGRIDVDEHGDAWRRLHLLNMHPAMCVRPGYVILLRGLFRGMYRLAKCDDEDFDMVFDAEGRELHAEFRWPGGSDTVEA